MLKFAGISRKKNFMMSLTGNQRHIFYLEERKSNFSQLSCFYVPAPVKEMKQNYSQLSGIYLFSKGYFGEQANTFFPHAYASAFCWHFQFYSFDATSFPTNVIPFILLVISLTVCFQLQNQTVIQPFLFICLNIWINIISFLFCYMIKSNFRRSSEK